MGTTIENKGRVEVDRGATQREDPHASCATPLENVQDLRKELSQHHVPTGGAEALMGVSSPPLHTNLTGGQPERVVEGTAQPAFRYQMTKLRDENGNEVYAVQMNERGEPIRVPVSTIETDRNGELIRETVTTKGPSEEDPRREVTPLITTEDSRIDLIQEKDEKGRITDFRIQGTFKF